MVSAPPAVPLRQTFLRYHIERELHVTDDVLGVRELIQQLPPEQRPGPEDPVRARLLVEFFHQCYSGSQLCTPLRLSPDDQARQTLAEVRRCAPEERDPLASLTALLRALERAGDHRGVVLCAGSGAGKTVACRRAFLDCIPREAFARLPGNLLARRDLDLTEPSPLAGLLPVWLPTRTEASSRLAAGNKTQQGKLDLPYDLLVEASHRDPARPQARWDRRFRERLPQWLEYAPLLLFLDLNPAEEPARQALAETFILYQETHGKQHGHRVVVTYRSTRGDDPSMSDLRKSGLFLFFDLQTIDLATARGYLRNYREFEKSVYQEVLPAPADYRPATDEELDEECRLLEELATRHVRGREALISTPLLMHLVAGLGRSRLAGVRSLADLYEQVVDRYIERDLNGPIRSPRLKDRQDACVLVRTAMTRVALAIHARGSDVTQLGSVQELYDLLRHPEDVGREGNGSVRWWPDDPAWSGMEKRRVPYYWESFQHTEHDPEAKDLLEFGLLRRTGNQVGFLHDSFIPYFTGVLGLRHYRGPVLPGGSLPSLTDEWLKRIVKRMMIDPIRWRNPAEFLGGVLTEQELRLLLLELIPAQPREGLPTLVQKLLQERRPGDDPVLRILDHTLRLPEVHAMPETLFHQCHDDLEWPNLSGNAEAPCRAMAEQLRQKMSRSWLRCLNRGPRSTVVSMSQHSKAVMALVVLRGGRIASGSLDNTVRLWNPATGKVQVMDQHTDSVWALAVLTDGRIASGSFDATVRLWDPVSGQVQVMDQHTDRVEALAVLPDGRIASGSRDNTVRLWEPRTGATIIFDAGSPVIELCFSQPHGHSPSIVLGTANGRVLLLELIPD